ncbi:hypothetical protein GCM10018791_59890 [Streptomyces zaomyceticus]|nr:hypothetical protein GCM10018791_59890 [Streptomyces zaomyceticus]
MEAREVGYVLAVSCATKVQINQGRTPIRADAAADCLPASAWQRQSAGSGAKGPRYYDWAWVQNGTDEHRYLPVRHNPTTDELAFCLCWSPRAVLAFLAVAVDAARPTRPAAPNRPPGAESRSTGPSRRSAASSAPCSAHRSRP